jgi:hypothetical protein
MKRLLISCTDDEERVFLDLARRYKNNASILGRHAIQRLIALSNEGGWPKLQPPTQDATSAARHIPGESPAMKHLLFSCSEAEEKSFLELAERCGVLPSLLGQQALQQVLEASYDGIGPMLRPSKSKRPFILKRCLSCF